MKKKSKKARFQQYEEIEKKTAHELHKISLNRLEEYEKTNFNQVDANKKPSWINDSNEKIFEDEELLKIFHFYLENSPTDDSARAKSLMEFGWEDETKLKEYLLNSLKDKDLIRCVPALNRMKIPLENLKLDKCCDWLKNDKERICIHQKNISTYTNMKIREVLRHIRTCFAHSRSIKPFGFALCSSRVRFTKRL